MKVVSRKRGITKIGIGLALKGGVSTLALCAMSAAAPAWAAAETPAKVADPAAPVLTAAQASPSQAAPEEPSGDEKDIVVTGIRASLASAQNIKRNSDTVVDAITAQDIGALPDRSVTEALQRIPGVAMNRFAGSNDPDHFSVEGSGVVVRGLTFVRSEFNGRDTFSAGVGGQAINFADVPAELLGSVEVYKNSTAEMIEGGLAGTVNLNTRKPFDNKGFHFSLDAEANYGDLKRKWSPTFSGLISNTWDTGIGTVGVLVSASYSRLYSKSNGINISNIQTRDGVSVLQSNSTTAFVCRNPLPTSTDTTTLPPGGSNAVCGAASTPGTDGLADNAGTRYAPIGGQFREEDYDRKRKGIAFAAQWESLDRRALVTVQGLHTDSSNNWGEHTFESASDLSEYNTYPAGCQQNANGPGGSTRGECPVGSLQNYSYDANGVFEKGLITYPGGGWRGNPTKAGSPVYGGMQQSLSRRQVDERNRVSNFGVNFKFEANEHLSFNLDADYTKAQHDNLDVSVFGSTFADNYLDLTGSLPTVVAHKPSTIQASWATPNPVVAAENDAQYFGDRNNQFWRAAMDHIEHSTGHEVAVKGDVVYKFNDDGSFLKRFKFGARYADREQTIRTSNYNWGVLSEVWGGNDAIPVSFAQSSANSSLYQFDNFFRGATGGPPAAYYYNGDLIKDYAGSSNYFKTIGQLWSVTNNSQTSTWTPAAGRAGVIAGTPYLPSEIQPVSQKTGDAYMMLSFGREEPLFGGIKVDGNIGLRYVTDQVKTTGSIGAPTAQQLGVLDPFSVRCPPPAVPPGSPPGTPIPPVSTFCAQGPASYALLQQFAGDGSNVSNSTSNRYSYFLPSLNLKFGLSDDMLIRFAASRVLTRPDMADLRNYVGIGLAGDGITLTTTAGNPYLKPARAWQFDLTYEWYFAKVGSLTIDAFYKDVTGFFYQNQFYRPITNNGVTLATLVRGPDNFPAHGKIKGVEVAYQQTFTFLPWIFSGLGTQLSYTYLKSSGIPNSFLNGGSPSNVSRVPAGNLPLEQLSKHNVNATVFFEKGPVSLRAAYTWRSKFLLTASDVIFPYFPIYNDSEGHLDASAFLNITKKIKLGVQGVNLTNTVTKTLQQYSAGGALGPRSYFISDRRFSFILRGSW
ncbi:MAG: TonB-dependent receptor [Sphingomonas sp.]